MNNTYKIVFLNDNPSVEEISQDITILHEGKDAIDVLQSIGNSWYPTVELNVNRLTISNNNTTIIIDDLKRFSELGLDKYFPSSWNYIKTNIENKKSSNFKYNVSRGLVGTAIVGSILASILAGTKVYNHVINNTSYTTEVNEDKSYDEEAFVTPIIEKIEETKDNSVVFLISDTTLHIEYNGVTEIIELEEAIEKYNNNIDILNKINKLIKSKKTSYYELEKKAITNELQLPIEREKEVIESPTIKIEEVPVLTDLIIEEKIENENKDEDINDELERKSISLMDAYEEAISYVNNSVEIRPVFTFEDNRINTEEKQRDMEIKMNNVMQYKDTIDKYSNIWGISPNLIYCVMAQESGAKGDNIMRITFNVWKDYPITQYNFQDGCYQTIVLTNDASKYKDTDYICISQSDLKNSTKNVSVGCVIMKESIDQMKGNTIAGIQCYNNGCTAMNRIIRKTADELNMTPEEVLKDLSNNEFIKYTNIIESGDPNYYKNVLIYLEQFDNTINIKYHNVLDDRNYTKDVEVINTSSKAL